MTDPRLYLRPTAFVDAPFGHDGKVARLAGGLAWFAAVELMSDNGGELLTIEMFERRLDRLGDETAATWARLTGPRPPLRLGERIVRLDQPQVAGILNVTPDSFSDGGRFAEAETAIAAGHAMAAAGAAIVDVGGESTRPGSKPVWEGDEAARIVPVIRALAQAGTAVSADTRKAAVVEAALAAGARLINDVSALTWDHRAAEVVAKAD